MSNPLKIDNYIAQGQSRQFSQDKMDSVTKVKLGRSKMSPGLTDEMERARKFAKLKGWNLETCLICGANIFSKNTREKCKLCKNHIGLKSVVMNILAKRKANKLTPEDIQSLARTHTVRSGPFFNTKDPTGELRKKGIIK